MAKEKKQNLKKKSESIISRLKVNAAGIDIGSEKIFVSVENQPVKIFDTFTIGIHQARDYMKENQVKSVAMEATGIYWMSIYEILDSADFEVYVVNGAHVKNVPGRKTDVSDSEWLRELHSCGLLRNSFIPKEKLRTLRTYLRMRSDHISIKSQHIQHMQKCLDSMNLKLHNVISDIHGVSGMRIIEAILQGETDATKLVELCDERILKTKRELVILSLQGNYKKEHLFGLQQAVNAYNFYEKQIRECHEAIEEWLEENTKDLPKIEIKTKAKHIRHHAPGIKDMHEKLLKYTGGKDASRIPGLSDITMMRLIAETGTDLKSYWPTKKQFTSWCGLTPPNNQSGKIKKRRKIKRINKVGQIFRESAYSVSQTKDKALGGFYRRIKNKTQSGGKANKATARKIAERYYDIFTKGIEYVEQGLEMYQKQCDEKMKRSIIKRAKALGLEIIEKMAS